MACVCVCVTCGVDWLKAESSFSFTFTLLTFSSSFYSQKLFETQPKTLIELVFVYFLRLNTYNEDPLSMYEKLIAYEYYGQSWGRIKE